jgi:hypothetical protein
LAILASYYDLSVAIDGKECKVVKDGKVGSMPAEGV